MPVLVFLGFAARKLLILIASVGVQLKADDGRVFTGAPKPSVPA